jgi:hypothetical protein
VELALKKNANSALGIYPSRPIMIETWRLAKAVAPRALPKPLSAFFFTVPRINAERNDVSDMSLAVH